MSTNGASRRDGALEPWLVDAFCGAGGATRGFQLAGFRVIGVDVHPQPNYCGDEFVQADALEYLKGLPSHVVGVAASPPCLHYADVTAWRGNQEDHPALIAPTRELLEKTGLPYVIENVRTKALRHPFMLCGSQFGLPIRRHRYFETNWHPFRLAQPCLHRRSDYSFDHGAKQPESVYRDAMGVEWMTVEESRQAIPPAYTEAIGKALLSALPQDRKEAA